MITTVKALKENLNENFTDTDSIYVLFFSKEEFESNFDSKVTNKVWESALAVVDDEEADAIIQNQIADELSTLLDEKE
jgi:tRNA(His) 5'-end guanylyltransferase